MTTLYNGQFYLQGLNTTVPGVTGITSADTILSVLNNIQTNIPSTVMMEIGSYNQNVANGTPIYKYLMGFSNSASGLGGYYTMDGITKSSSVRFLTMYQSGGNVQVGINTASPLYTLDVNGSIHAANTLIVDSATTLKNTLNVQSATVLSNTLTVQNATTLNDRLTVNGETKIDNTLFVVYGATFNNTLTVQSATVLNNTLTVGNATTLSRLTVNATTINDTLYVQNGTTLNDTLKVRNATTLSNTLSVTGATTATGLITANGGLQVNGYANATGLITGGAGLSITGATTLSGNVTSSGGIFYGNGSGLTNVNAATATIATSANTATYATTAGTANPNTIIIYRNQGAIDSTNNMYFSEFDIPLDDGFYYYHFSGVKTNGDWAAITSFYITINTRTTINPNVQVTLPISLLFSNQIDIVNQGNGFRISLGPDGYNDRSFALNSKLHINIDFWYKSIPEGRYRLRCTKIA